MYEALPAWKYTTCVSSTQRGRRGHKIPRVGVAKDCELPHGPRQKQRRSQTWATALALVWGLFVYLFVCFLTLDLMYPRLTMKFWSSCPHLPKAHDRWGPQPGILSVIVNDSSSASTVFSQCFASGFGSAVLSVLVPLLSLLLFSTTEITGWLQVPWLELQCGEDKIRRTLGQLENLLLWME